MAVPMQVAQLEEGRAGQARMATSPRDPKIFLAPVFFFTAMEVDLDPCWKNWPSAQPGHTCLPAWGHHHGH